MNRTDRRTTRDHTLGAERPITRRDFLNGASVAVGSTFVGGLSPEFIATAFAGDRAPQDAAGYYPPALTAKSGATRTPNPAQGGRQSGDCGQQVMAA